MNDMINMNMVSTAWVCYMAAVGHLKEGADVLLGDGRVQPPQLDPPLFYGDSSFIDAAIHEACQCRVGLHLPCHGRVQSCHP